MLFCMLNNVLAQDKNIDWLSYRDVYKSMIWFEKFGKPKHLIENQLQIVFSEKQTPMENIRVSLSGNITHINLPVDSTGRVAIPLLKSAYDENASLIINQKNSQSVGVMRTRVRLTIKARTDGLYAISDLKAACEQIVNYQHYIGVELRGRQCVGVRMAFSSQVEAAIQVRTPNLALQLISGSENLPLWDVVLPNIKTQTYRFANGDDRSQLQTIGTPIAIAALFE